MSCNTTTIKKNKKHTHNTQNNPHTHTTHTHNTHTHTQHTTHTEHTTHTHNTTHTPLRPLSLTHTNKYRQTKLQFLLSFTSVGVTVLSFLVYCLIVGGGNSRAVARLLSYKYCSSDIQQSWFCSLFVIILFKTSL